jgi:hypothetical protein
MCLTSKSVGGNVSFAQAVIDCIDGKFMIVLLTGKPLFLGCGQNIPISEQASSRIMVKSRNSKNIHDSLLDNDNIRFPGIR